MSLKLYSDPGIVDGGIEMFRIGRNPSEDSLIYESTEPIQVPRGEWFSRIRIPMDYDDVYNACYLRAVYRYGENNYRVYWGWVDQVFPISLTGVGDDAVNRPVTEIAWHLDLWQTYKAQARFDYGHVRRKPYDSAKSPPQEVPYSYRNFSRVAGSEGDLTGIDDTGVYWALVQYVRERGVQNIVSTITFPMRRNTPFVRIVMPTDTQPIPRVVPSADMFFLGGIEEILGLAPSSILTASFSPLPPFAYTGDGYEIPIIKSDTDEGGLWTIGTREVTIGASTEVFAWYESTAPDVSLLANSATRFRVFEYEFADGYKTNDFKTFLITDMNNRPVGSLPWGLKTTGYTARIVMTGLKTYIEFRMRSGIIGTPEGMTFLVPLPSVDITTNSWSEYVYSGQREYDAQSMRISADHALSSGVISAFGSSVGGGLMGGLSGNPLGVLFGGIGMLGTGLITSGVQNVVQRNTNDRMLDATALYKANQTDNIIGYGDAAFDTFLHGQGIYLTMSVMDLYSQVMYYDRRDANGVLVDEHLTNEANTLGMSLPTLIMNGGPLQVENMIVGGEIPSDAKRYIRERFRNGVRLI